MARGLSIQHFLVSGDPGSITCAYMSNWTGQAIKIPRNQLLEARDRPELARPGVYFLFGFSENDPEQRIVYIGESENLMDRIYQQARDSKKEFWEEAVAFSSKDDNLTKGHIRYLEHKLISLALKSAEYDLDNSNKSVKPPLPEAAVAEMDTYLDNLKIILYTLGYTLLREVHASRPGRRKENILKLKMSGVIAEGKPEGNGFVVFRGSVANPKEKTSLPNCYLKLRERLFQKKIIELKDGKRVFSEDYEFNSPSQAAAILLGYPANGRRAWKDASGKTFGEIESEKVAASINT